MPVNLTICTFPLLQNASGQHTTNFPSFACKPNSSKLIGDMVSSCKYSAITSASSRRSISQSTCSLNMASDICDNRHITPPPDIATSSVLMVLFMTFGSSLFAPASAVVSGSHHWSSCLLWLKHSVLLLRLRLPRRLVCLPLAHTTGSVASSPAHALGFLHLALLLRL